MLLRTITTPPPTHLAYLVTGQEEKLTAEVMQQWFMQSIIPLVGKQAADALNALITREKDRGGDAFLKQAIKFRRTLK
jgi:hypothetical protein